MSGKARKSSGGTLTASVLTFVLIIGIPFLAVRTCARPSSGEGTRQAAVTPATDSAYERDARGVYRLTGPVMDTAGVLSAGERAGLESALRDLEQSTGIQIAVLTVASLDGESIEEFSMRHAESWRLGQEGVDNGALLTVAMAERAIRIETGYGTEGALTDAKCSRIIRSVIVPKFQAGEYGEGIVAGVENMIGVVTEDESLVSPAVRGTERSSSDTVTPIVMGVWLLCFLGIILLAIKNGGKGGGSGTGGTRVHTGSSSGGGYRGGGGGFGGGGASGHW